MQEALGENYAAAPLPTININGQDSQLRNFGEGNGVDKAILGGDGGDSACGVELTQAVQLVADGEHSPRTR